MIYICDSINIRINRKSGIVQKFQPSDGFSVVEMLITLAVAGMAVTIIMSIYASATFLSDKSSDTLTANEIAYTKLQEFENKPFEEIPTVTTDNSGAVTDPDKYEEDFASLLPQTLERPYEAKVFISGITDTTTLKYVLVRIKYGSSDKNQVIEYGSLIQQSGIGR